MTSAVPPFSSNADRYDQSTFYGRFRKMVDVVDPRSLTCTAADRERAQGLLRGHKDGTLASGQATDTELWAAKKLVDATIHPDTGELIPMPFRMSGFVPFNGPICLGALLATSPGGIFFWHWCVCLISRRARRGRRRRWGGVGWWNEGGGGGTVIPLCVHRANPAIQYARFLQRCPSQHPSSYNVNTRPAFFFSCLPAGVSVTAVSTFSAFHDH